MNVYALFPLIATLAYIPLLAAAVSSRPGRRQNQLFVFFLITAMMWSLTDYLFRSNFYPQHNLFLFKLILIFFTAMSVQFHVFTSSYFTPGQGRWLVFAYTSLGVVVLVSALGYLPEGVTVSGDRLYPEYGPGVIFIALPLLTLLGRNIAVFWRRLKILDNPVQRNQIVSLLVSLFVLPVFALAALLPWLKEFPVSHFGNLLIAFVLSFAVIRHQLVDIRLVLRRGLAWVSLGIIGAMSYWVLLSTMHLFFNFAITPPAMFGATLAAIIVAVFTYHLRDVLFISLGKAFHGTSYDYRQKLSDFAGTVHNVFSLREQGRELLTLATMAVGCRRAALLFPEGESGDFTAQLVEPHDPDNPLARLRLGRQNPITAYLQQQRRLLTRQNLATLPEFRSLWEKEREELETGRVELLVPLISRDRLVGVMVLDRRKAGQYSLEDLDLLEEVAQRVAVSIEKEYLREQLRQREQELAIINRSSAIFTSSLDIQKIYDDFIKEIKKAVEVDWAAITLIEGDELYLLAVSSDFTSTWQVGDRLPLKNTATEWMVQHREAFVEPDLKAENRFTNGKYHLQHGIRAIAYLPLPVGGRIIGSLTVASRHPNTYDQRQLKLLEQLAAQVAMPIENSRLYAKAEEKARRDDLTGLLNRRSLDELIPSEIDRHSRYGGVFSLIILDVDSLKAFNDSYGHLAGDTLLREVGSIMKGAIRSVDQAFRYGGDEFAILLPQTPIDTAQHVAERIRRRVAAMVKSSVPVTASLGLASWPTDGISPQEIIAAADAALYQAKRSGGNRSICATGAPLPLPSTDTSPDGNNSHSENSRAANIIFNLAASVDAREHYSGSHSKKVHACALALGKAINLELPELTRLSTCALLHDVGKIAINDKILNKPDKLTAEEWAEVRTHPRLGAAITSHARELAPCLPGILYHHEKYDASGYPDGLKGEAIPLEARILAIADAFSAMTSRRPHSVTLSEKEALEEIRRGAGTHFDPVLVEAFLAIFPKAPVTTTRKTG